MATNPDEQDVVYVVRPGDDNEELRYSIRSIEANLPHRRLWIVGHLPSWVQGATHIPTAQHGTKYRNSTYNLRVACQSSRVSPRFTLVNDDMFIMKPLADGMPVYHRGSLASVIREYDQRWAHKGPYLQGMKETGRWLVEMGRTNLVSYELHVPLPVSKRAMGRALTLAATTSIRAVHKRTLYGNLEGIGGTLMQDVKVCENRPDWDESWPFLSTDDKSFESATVGEFIRDSFPRPSSYEKV